MSYHGWVKDASDVTHIQRYLCGLKWNDYAIAEIRKVAHLKRLGLFAGNGSGQNQKRF